MNFNLKKSIISGFVLFILAVLIGCPILFARWRRLTSIQNTMNQRKEDAKKINGIVYKVGFFMKFRSM